MSDVNFGNPPPTSYPLPGQNIGVNGDATVENANITIVTDDAVDTTTDTVINIRTTDGKPTEGITYNANASIPDLPEVQGNTTTLDNIPKALPDAPGEDGYENLLSFFDPARTGGESNRDQAASNLQSFIKEFPPQSKEYKALMEATFPDNSVGNAATKMANTEFILAVRDHFLASQASDSSSTSTGEGVENGSGNGEEGSLFTLQAGGKNTDGSDGMGDGEGGESNNSGNSARLLGGATSTQGALNTQESQVVANADGTFTKDGVATDKNGSPITQNPDGTFSDVNGALVDKSGNPITQLSDGTFTNAAGESVDQFGNKPNAADADAVVANPDGTFTKNGVQTDKNGSPITLNSDGTYSDIKGSLVDKTGTPITKLADGSFINAAGQPVDQFGKVLSATAVVDPRLTDLDNQIDAAKKMLGDMEVTVNALPDSANKSIMLAYLSKISKAISEFTELLYKLQATDSGQVKDFTNAKLDETLKQIHEQAKAALKQTRAAKKGKKKSGSTIMDKIMKGITIAVLICVAVAFAPLVPVGALLMVQAVDMCMKMAGSKTSLWKKAFDWAQNAVLATFKFVNENGIFAQMGLKIPEKDIEMLAKIYTYVLVAIAIATVSIGCVFAGGDTIKAMLFDTGIIKNEKLKMALGLVIDAVLLITSLIVSICVGILLSPSGPPAALAALGPIFTLLNAVKGATSTALTLTMAVVALVMATVNYAYALSSGINQICLAKIKMDLNKELGKLEENIQLKQLMIEMLKKMIKSLQDAMTGLNDVISAVKNGQNANWKNLNSMMTKLFAGV